jgi:ribosomal-protein-alanine N-acetyltransferase
VREKLASVRDLCRPAAAGRGLHALRAATSHGNAASRRVLAKTGFVPADLGGKQGTW